MGIVIIGIHLKNIFTEVGSADFVHSFFSTISFHLEPDGWGTRFPELMNHLYQGRLEPAMAAEALAQARTCKGALQTLDPDRVVWDIDRIHLKPPWRDEIPSTVTSLANYHRTVNGLVLMDALIDILDYQVSCQEPIRIGSFEALVK